MRQAANHQDALRSTSMLHSSPTRCIGKGVFAADDASHGQRLSPSPLMSNDEPCYAARRRRRSRARQRVPACAKSPRSAASATRHVAPLHETTKELALRRRPALYEKRKLFWRSLCETHSQEHSSHHFLTWQPSPKPFAFPLTQTRPENPQPLASVKAVCNSKASKKATCEN